jgi:hypothetical protein
MTTVTKTIGTGYAATGTGTVSTNNSVTVTGTSTSFTTEFASVGEVQMTIRIDSVTYSIESVGSDTVITLRPATEQIGGSLPNTGAGEAFQIGTRDYSTIVAWEADLSDDAVYADTNDAVGVMYADSTFTDATVTINGGISIGGSSGQDLASVTLTVVAADRHDGTAESGALLKPTANSGHDVGIIRIDRDNVTIEWLDISLDSLDARNTNKAIVLTGTNDDNIIRNNLIHDKGGNPGSAHSAGIHRFSGGAASDTLSILNNIIYSIVETSGDHTVGINLNQWAGIANLYNNTVYKITSNGGSKYAYGFLFGREAGATVNIKNNLVALLDGAQERAYYKNGSGSTANTANNLSDDTAGADYDAEDMAQSLNDSSSLIGQTLTEISFVSTGVGTEDLHIDEDSVCVDAGADLGTTGGVQTDINGRDRDASADTWDIGAHEFVPEATAGASFLLFLD